MNRNEPRPESVSTTLPSPGQVQGNAGLLTALLGQCGIASIRAAVLDPASMEAHSRWSLSTQKEAQAAADAGSGSAFFAARDAGASLRGAPAEHTVVRKLSPRLWSFAWLAGPDQMVVVEARYRDQRDMLNDKDSALVRLVFLSLSPSGIRDSDELSLGVSELSWPSVDRRSRSDCRGQLRSQALPLVLLGLSAGLAGWLAFIALPAASDERAARQAETLRLQTMADNTVVAHLSAALATGDYGELQDELSGFHALGYFPGAAVLGVRQRVVATVGMGNDAAIGATVSAAVAATTRSVPLVLGGDELGRLLYLERTAQTDRVAIPTLKGLAGASTLAALAAAALLLPPALRRRR